MLQSQKSDFNRTTTHVQIKQNINLSLRYFHHKEDEFNAIKRKKNIKNPWNLYHFVSRIRNSMSSLSLDLVEIKATLNFLVTKASKHRQCECEMPCKNFNEIWFQEKGIAKIETRFGFCNVKNLFWLLLFIFLLSDFRLRFFRASLSAYLPHLWDLSGENFTLIKNDSIITRRWIKTIFSQTNPVSPFVLRPSISDTEN